ncbi:MAG: hypothetical protein NDI69_06020 [Bacteriovoracaceae bacterium]|nr:hypothetical protein [Bacteriovoracaceae bacterium]
MFIRLLAFFLSFPVGATVFQVQSVDQQIREADGIVIGHYLSSKPVKLDNGSIATQMIFKMNQEYGMQSDFFGMNEVIVHYPGGKLGDLNVKVEGVPEFIPGENVILMIKSFQNRYWGLNLGFGTFRVINYGNEKMIVNSIFPNDLKASQIKLREFEKSVRTIKGEGLKVVFAPEYSTEKDGTQMERSPASVEEGKNRAIASKIDQVENNEDRPVNNFGLIFLLAFLGGLFRFTRQKEAK